MSGYPRNPVQGVYVHHIGPEGERVYRDVQPGATSLRWECAYCGGFREDAAGCPGCGASRDVAGYEMTMGLVGRQTVRVDLEGPGAFRRLTFGPTPAEIELPPLRYFPP